jgi:hypothetical protein
MGTQQQTPNSQTPQRQDAQRDPKSSRKEKDAGNVPHSDDDVAGEANQGTREDAAGSNARKS